MIFNVRDSVDVLEICKKCIVDRILSDEIIVDMKDFAEYDETEVNIFLKLENLVKSKNINIKFINQNGMIRQKKENLA